MHTLAGDFLASLQLTDLDGGTPLAQPRGLDLFERPMPGFPLGVLVVQDGVQGNYKIFSLADVNAVFPLPEPFDPNPPVVTDAGISDGGTDGGFTDAGAGAGGGAGGGGGGAGAGSGNTRPPPTADPNPTCGCTGGPFALLPALLALWCIRRRRFTP